jgi:hypothetical protein
MLEICQPHSMIELFTRPQYADIISMVDPTECEVCIGNITYDVGLRMEMWDITDDTTVTCKCGNNCEATSKDTDCACFNIPCEDDEGLCEHLRGCLHGECECECEF